jgi:hypothetical protein
MSILLTTTQLNLQDKIQKLIENKNLNITEQNFINKNSKFIIITYWWGRGRINSNTQVPCKELHYLGYNWQLKDGKKLKKEPDTFDNMIKKWENYCISNNCNYFSQEYPEFTEPGGYQLAINAKPLFIKKVLDTLKNMGKEDISVVYIDGDMTVNKYPHIFDMKNVDYMARGWNIDPRSNVHYKTAPCFDPFTFETSGGIMYFANNDYARTLLNMWNKWSFMKKFEGKADDRILSMLINSKQLYVNFNILQLPMEYLWLTDAYQPQDERDEYLDQKHFNRKDIIFEHPACLTTEESAREQGAANDRQPAYYDKLVENNVECQSEGGILNEFIVFDTLAQATEWNKYLQYISSDDASLGKNNEGEHIIPYYIKKFKESWGNKTDFAIKNTEKLQKIKNYLKENTDIDKYDLFYLIYDSEKIEINKDKIYIKKESQIIFYILTLLDLKKMVIYIPNKYIINNIPAFNNLKTGTSPTKLKTNSSSLSNISLKNILKNKDKYELICNIKNHELQYPIIDEKNPIFFHHTSTKLYKLLRMSKNISEFNVYLKQCALYVQLIRCKFITNYNMSPAKIKQKTLSLVRSKIKHTKNNQTY